MCHSTNAFFAPYITHELAGHQDILNPQKNAGKISHNISRSSIYCGIIVLVSTPRISYNTECSSFINTNLIHNFFYKLHKIKFLYMFQAPSAHPQEVNDVNCICMQPLVSSSSGGRLVQSLKGEFYVICRNCVSSWY
jgi:hypothetical protein